MNIKQLLKWGNKGDTGKMVFIVTLGLLLLLFLNRYNLVLNNNICDFCIKENVKFWQDGTLQLIRSFLEHFSFNFFTPMILVLLSLGFDKLFNQNLNWRIFFIIGALCSISMTLIWEFQKSPVEWTEVFYDIAAIIVSYLFVRWQLKEFDLNIKQNSKKERNNK